MSPDGQRQKRDLIEARAAALGVLRSGSVPRRQRFLFIARAASSMHPAAFTLNQSSCTASLTLNARTATSILLANCFRRISPRIFLSVLMFPYSRSVLGGRGCGGKPNGSH